MAPATKTEGVRQDGLHQQDRPAPRTATGSTSPDSWPYQKPFRRDMPSAPAPDTLPLQGSSRRPMPSARAMAPGRLPKAGRR
jgi:hypothetical protein